MIDHQPIPLGKQRFQQAETATNLLRKPTLAGTLALLGTLQGKHKTSAGNFSDIIHHTTNLLAALLGNPLGILPGMRRRAGDQPPNAEPSKRNPTTAEEENKHCSAEGIRGENLNKRSDGEEYSIYAVYHINNSASDCAEKSR
jgi:hypothetical protein